MLFLFVSKGGVLVERDGSAFIVGLSYFFDSGQWDLAKGQGGVYINFY